MKIDNPKRVFFLVFALIFLVAAGFIAAVCFVINRVSMQSMQIYPTREPAKVGQVLIDPNSGGSAPTQIPSATPEPLQGMASPAFCKLELAGLTNKAKERGASGMLNLNGYDFGKKACIFDIKNTVGIGNAGKIEIFQDPDTQTNGITISVNKAREGILQKWGEAVLLYFNSDVTVESAETDIQKVLTEGTVESPLYRLNARDSAVFSGETISAVRIIEIRSNTRPEEN